MNELEQIQNLTQEQAVTVFVSEKTDELLKRIKEEARSVVHDVNTAQGRKDIASLAYNIAKAKTKLDGLGKELTAEWKEKSKRVDNYRKKIREELDQLKVEVRKPLTDYETALKIREQEIAEGLDHLEQLGDVPAMMMMSSAQLKMQLKEIEEHEVTKEFYEESYRIALSRHQKAKENCESCLEKVIEREEKDAELARLKKEQEQREEEERIQKEKDAAAEKARLEAEEKLKAQQREAERQKEEAEERARQADERAKRAEERAKQAEADAKRKAEEAAEEARKQAAKKAKEDAERARQEELRIKTEEAEKERKRLHFKEVNESVESLLIKYGMTEEQSKKLVDDIKAEQVQILKIVY